MSSLACGNVVGARAERFDLVEARAVLLSGFGKSDRPDRAFGTEPPRLVTVGVFADRPYPDFAEVRTLPQQGIDAQQMSYAGILAPLVTGLSTGDTSLLVLAVGSGSLFFSHVNDAGFWLVKEYFGLSVGQTIKSWSLMETVISVCGLVFVLALNIVV